MKFNLIFQFLLLTPFLSAQTFTEVIGTPFDGVLQSSVSFVDVDSDNDQDVLLTGRNDSGDLITKLYTNDGMANFSEVTGPPFEDISESYFAFEDVDGDNDQDLLITGYTELFGLITRLYINDGLGNFSEVMGTSFEAVGASSIVFADVDNDNDQDVLITGVSISKLYTNDGMGNFSEVTGTPFEGPNLNSVAFADVDGDNDQDVLITGISTTGTPTSKMYTNDGMGNFTESTTLPFESFRVGTIAFADVDGDNDQDLFITDRGNSGTVSSSRLYTNDGAGNFSEVMNTSFEGVSRSAIAFADVDGDNDPDLLLTGRPNSGIWISKLYINDGTGSFSEVMNTTIEGVEQGSIDFADVDGDNDQDLLITGYGNSGVAITRLYLNDFVSAIDDLVIELNLDFTLFPNPIIEKNLNIHYNSKENGFVNILIYDLNGQPLKQQEKFSIIGQQTFTIDIGSLVKGSYIIELNEGKRKGIAKFMVQ